MSELEVLAAYDQTPIARLPRADAAEMEEMLSEAHALYQDRDRWLPTHQRLSILEKTASIIEARVEALAMAAAREGGKPLTDSRVEVLRGIEGIKTAIAELRTEGGRQIPMGLTPSSEGHLAYTYREARGVVAAVSAFNHPFNLIIHQVIPAVATGCPVIVKPASTTPLSCRALLEILYEAGLPKAWARMLVTTNDLATQLVSDRRIGFFSFIGSSKIGWMLRAKLAPGVACAMEHGGVAPAIVDETADLDQAIPSLTKGGFYHAGQVCVSVQRVFVHRSIAEEFSSRLAEAAERLVVGDPTLQETEVGPLILPKEVERVAAWVEEARRGGAEVLCGGQKLSPTTYAPTVVINPSADSKLSTQEVFGPVVCVYPYDDIDDAVERANAVDAYFQAAVWTSNVHRAMKLAKRLNGMAVMVNQHTAFRVDWMPFGGHRDSGQNAGGIGYSMHDMTLERLLVIQV